MAQPGKYQALQNVIQCRDQAWSFRGKPSPAGQKLARWSVFFGKYRFSALPSRLRQEFTGCFIPGCRVVGFFQSQAMPPQPFASFHPVGFFVKTNIQFRVETFRG